MTLDLANKQPNVSRDMNKTKVSRDINKSKLVREISKTKAKKKVFQNNQSKVKINLALIYRKNI